MFQLYEKTIKKVQYIDNANIVRLNEWTSDINFDINCIDNTYIPPASIKILLEIGQIYDRLGTPNIVL